MVQLSHLHMTTGKTISIFVGENAKRQPQNIKDIQIISGSFKMQILIQ